MESSGEGSGRAFQLKSFRFQSKPLHFQLKSSGGKLWGRFWESFSIKILSFSIQILSLSITILSEKTLGRFQESLSIKILSFSIVILFWEALGKVVGELFNQNPFIFD